jgi:sporulation protein YlmC with PRC-barrel domain
MRLSYEALRGRPVIAAGGRVLGEVADVYLEFENNTWRVESLLVKLNRDAADSIGAARSFFRARTAPIPVQLVQSIGDTVVLSADEKQLRPRVVAHPSQPAVTH